MKETKRKKTKDRIADEHFSMLKLIHQLAHQIEFVIETVIKDSTPSVAFL